MGQKSSIKKLPKEVQQRLQDLYEADATLDDIHDALVDFLEQMDGDWQPPSRSAIHRDRRNYEATAAKMREAREMAQAVATEIGEIPEDKTGQLLVDMLRTLIFKVLQSKVEGEDPDVSPQDFMFLGRTLRDVASASQITTRQAKEIRNETASEAAKRAEKTAAERGLTKETADAIKKNILGIREEA